MSMIPLRIGRKISDPARGWESILPFFCIMKKKGKVEPMDNYILRAEYEEHSKRMEDEHRRMNHRIGKMEDDLKRLETITLSVEKLALNMENMCKEQQEQGERLREQGEQIASMKSGPADTVTRIKDKAIDAVVNTIMTALAVGMVLMIAQYIK